MDFERLLQEAEQEQAKLSQKLAVLDSKLNDLSEVLGLDKKESLEEQVKIKSAKCKEKIKELESALTDLVKKMQDLQLTSDENEF